jgi:hypothetical protein
MTKQWIQKYLYLNPCVFVTFHELGDGADADDSAVVTALNSLKIQLSKRDIRLLAVVVSNNASDDRIHQLRRATGLPPRTGLLHVPTSSTALEKETFVETVCQLAYSQALDYYNNVSKRVRRKRGTRPNALGDESLDKSPLSSAGWDVRYCFKLAALAEFKQELDTALSAYEHTYENLLELCETNNDIPEHRMKEIQVVIDAVVYRMVKISLYIEQPNVAYRKFSLHLQAMDSLNKIKGLSSNGLESVLWRARQYSALARLIELTQSMAIPNELPLAPAPDDNYPSVRLPRSGFLYLRAAELYKQALMDCSGDKNEDEIKSQITDTLKRASADFSLSDNHRRTIAYTLYQMAEFALQNDDLEAAFNGFKGALDVYKLDNWKPLQVQLLQKLQACALKLGHTDDCLKASMALQAAGDDDNSLANAIEKLDLNEEVLEGSFSPLKAQFAFETPSFNVGLPANAQLCLTPEKGNWTIDKITLDLGESMGEVTIVHNDQEDKEEGGLVKFEGQEGSTNLRFVGEGSGGTKLIQITQYPKKLGIMELRSIHGEMTLGTKPYSFAIPLTPLTGNSSISWLKNGRWMYRNNPNPTKAEIAPRPAKIKLSTDPASVGSVSAGELMVMNVVVDNQEKEEISLNLEAKVKTAEDKSVKIAWGEVPSQDGEATISDLKQEKGIKEYPFSFQVPFAGASGMSVEFFASYSLPHDEAEIKEAMSLSILVSKPFRVNFDVAPRVHPDPWGSTFIPENFSSPAHAPLISKRWDLSASLLFLGEGQVEITGTSLEVKPGNEEEAKCTIADEPENITSTLHNNEGMKLSYSFDTCRNSSKEIRTVSAEAYLKIQWMRKGSKNTNEYHIPVVRLNLPLHEPRVILDHEWIDKRYLRLMYYIENATNHILTYSISMGSSSIFAFQGPKHKSLRVLPFTRRMIEFVLLPLSSTTKDPLRLPQFKIHDTYYKRTLVVIPANRLLLSDRTDIFVPNPSAAEHDPSSST